MYGYRLVKVEPQLIQLSLKSINVVQENTYAISELSGQNGQNNHT
jgi:hypothetical protein